MKRKVYPSIRHTALALVLLLTPSAAWAHVGVGGTSGFVHGLLHPVTGLDHLAAMVAVGLWAAQLGGRALRIVPLTFASVMAASALVGALGIALPFVESGIAGSLLVFGVLIAAAVRLPLPASIMLIGLLAIFHGHAHGAEMPETASGLLYGAGFVLATVLLHGCGIAFGMAARHRNRPHLVRYAGGLTAVLGAYLFIG